MMNACWQQMRYILKELDVDYVDMFLIHTPKLGKDPTIELWKYLIEVKRLGHEKVIGVSNFNQKEIEDIADATGGEMPEANEIQQHPWSTESWKQLAGGKTKVILQRLHTHLLVAADFIVTKVATRIGLRWLLCLLKNMAQRKHKSY